MATISTHNGSSVAREHNIRNEKVIAKESHINPDGIHEVWHDEKPCEAYRRLFGKAVEEYNAQQKRADRRITDYYRAVQNDKKKHTVYEMIVAVGNKDNPIDDTIGKEILKDYYNSWQRRNPNLALIGAYYHADEEGVPHLHIDYVPVAHGYKRGLSVQNGLVKALGEQGYEKQGKETAQIQWERNENAALEKICNDYGIDVEHPLIEGRQHIDTDTFKAQQELQGEQEKLQKAKKDLMEWWKHSKNAVFDKFDMNVYKIFCEIDDVMRKKGLSYLSQKEYLQKTLDKLQKTIEQGKQIAYKSENYAYEVQNINQSLGEKCDSLMSEVRELKSKIQRLEKSEKQLKRLERAIDRMGISEQVENTAQQLERQEQLFHQNTRTRSHNRYERE